MKMICAVDDAIRNARLKGTLKTEKRYSERFSEDYVVILDDIGVITVAADEDEAANIISGKYK